MGAGNEEGDQQRPEQLFIFQREDRFILVGAGLENEGKVIMKTLFTLTAICLLVAGLAGIAEAAGAGNGSSGTPRFDTRATLNTPGNHQLSRDRDLYCTAREERWDVWPQYPHTGYNCADSVCVQSFTPQNDYILCRVSVVLNSHGSSSAYLYIQDGPTADAAVYAASSCTGIGPTEDWYDFDIGDIYLEVGQTYFIRVEGAVFWRCFRDFVPPGSDPYPYGAAYLNGSMFDVYDPPYEYYNDFWFITFTWGDEPPPIDECAPGLVHEWEPPLHDQYVDEYNGGCNSTPPVFQALEAIDPPDCISMCGKSGWYLFDGWERRDTDWFTVTAAGDTLEFTITAQYPTNMFIMNTDCNNLIILADAYAPTDVPTTINYLTSPGEEYWLWVGPADFGGPVTEYSYEMHVCGVSGGPVPTEKVSWGSVKSLYR